MTQPYKTLSRGPSIGLTIALFVWGELLWWWALSISSKTASGFGFGVWGIYRPSLRHVFMVIGTLALITGLLRILPTRRFGRPARWFGWFSVIGVAVVILAYVAADRKIEIIGLLAQSLRLAAPIALGAMAGIMCERSGVINIAIEGMMLFSACFGFVAAVYLQNIWIGLAMAVISGMVLGVLHALLSIRFMVDQIISGTVINILAVGVTGFMRRAYLGHGSPEAPSVLPVWRIPWLSDIPVAGKVLFNHQPLVYLTIILTVVLHIALFHTRWGLRTRAVGEHPRAVDTLGVSVFRLRYMNVIIGGGLAGLGGAWFSLETVGRFDEIMTGGKGFIALAAMIFGKWTPFGALGGALLFGSADALQLKLQIVGANLPYQFLSMLPYVATMIVLAVFIGRSAAPAADGVPYRRDT
jgi:ABC-type uncharacterized transport system permease subunit